MGLYANGIVSAGNRYLLVVSLARAGWCAWIVKTRAVREVDLGGDLITVGDGMIRSGHTLYAVNTGQPGGQAHPEQELAEGDAQAPGQGAELPLPHHGGHRRQPDAGGELAVRQADGGTPALPFTVSAIPLP